MMSATVCTEPSGPQKRPVMAFIRHLRIRQQPRSQKRRSFRPVCQEPKKTEMLDNSTSHSRTCNADPIVDGPTSPWADVAKELTAENDHVSPPVDVDKRVATTSRGTSGGLEQLDIRCERPNISKSHPPLAGIVDIEEKERRTSSGVRNKMQRVKTHAISSFDAAIPRFKRRYPGINESIMTASTVQQALPSSVHDEPPRSQTTQRADFHFTPTTVLFHAEDEKQKLPDAKGAEKTASESEEVKKLKRDLSESHSRIAELQKRLESQSRDLESSNSFLNTADKSSDSDAIRALQRLNAEVQQNTTYMADSLAEDFKFENMTTNPAREQNSAVQRVSRRLGSVLVHSFGTSALEDIPMLLQISFQAYFASVLCQATSCWAFEPYNRFIREIYQRMRRIEAQAISGRWRSLTRAHNAHSWITHPESLIKGIIADISDIILAAGCTAPQSDIITKVTSKFEGKISLLVELTAGLGKVFDEVISSDFEVFIARPGETFKDKMMEDADEDQAGTEEALVLCATHIGLMKRVPVGTLWERGKKQKITVLKAKVLLESFLSMELDS